MGIFNDSFTQKASERAIGRVATAPKGGDFFDNVGAAWDSFQYTEASGANDRHISEAYQQRADLIKQLTGDDVGNPYSGSAIQDVLQGQAQLTANGMETPAETREREIQAYEARVTAALDKLPDRERRMVKTRAEMEADIQREAQRLETRQAELAATSGFGGVAGQVVGGLGAAMTQPEQIATLPIGAPAKVGIVGRILAEAAIGAATEAVRQPMVQRQRDELGLESGFEMAAENVAMGAVGGAVFAGGIEAARAIIRGGNAAFRAKFGRPPNASEAAALQTAQRALEVEAVAPFEQRTAATAAVHNANQTAAAAAAIDGRLVTAAELSPQAPTPRAPLNDPSGPYEILGNAEINAIGTDARLMQFKAGGDEAGVTDRLAGVTAWDPERSGIMLVYEYEDGSRIIADGHQRLGLAKRLAGEGQDIQAAALVLREADGVSPGQARARAAYKNMAEGTGTATDAAKILRDAGASVGDLNLPPKSALLRDAEGLANVNDDVFGMVVNEVLEDRFAAAIGRMVSDPLLQTDIAGLLTRLRPASLFEAEQIIDQARRSGVVRSTQENLFGEADVAESLYLDRARVLDRAQRLLRQDAATFRTLLDRAGDIAAEGNVLDETANVARLETDQMVLQFIRALSNRKGPIGNALTDAAAAAKSDGNYARAARSFLETVGQRIDDPEVAGAAGRGDWRGDEFTRPDGADSVSEPVVVADENTLNLFDNPTGPRAVEQTDRLQREITDAVVDSDEGFAVPEIGAPVSIGRRPPGVVARILQEFKERAPVRSVEESYVVLPAMQQQLETVGKRLGRRKGVTFKTPGLKAIDGAREKMTRKNYTSTRELTDLVRAGFEVETPEQANALVATLSKTFRVLDEGWQANGQLYFDRKVLVQFDDGTIGEVQIWNPALLKVKRGGGHKLYNKMRKLDRASPEYRALEIEQRNLYGAAIDQLSDDWLDEVWLSSASNGGSGGTLGKIWPNMRGETGVPESLTSRGSAASQADSPRGTTNALPTSENTTAGRPSQLTNDGSNAEAPYVDTTYNRDPDAAAQEIQSAQLMDRIRNEGSDLRALEIPIGEALDADGNRVPEVRTLGEVLDDIEADDQFLAQLDVCDRSAA